MPFIFTVLIDDIDLPVFEDIYNKYYRLMLTVSFNYVHSEYLAQDAVQNAFLSVAKNYSKIKSLSEKEMKAYLLTLTRTCSINIYNNEKKNTFSDVENNDIFSDDEIENIDNQDLLAKLIIKLKPIYRDTLILKYKYDYTYKEIAKMLSISENLVRKRIEIAKKTLSKYVNEQNIIY